MGKTSIMTKALDAVAKGVAGIDERFRNPPLFSGVNENLSAIAGRLDALEQRLDRLEKGLVGKVTRARPRQPP